VHRLVDSFIDGQSCHYTQAEITDISNQSTDAMKNAQYYEQASMMVHLAKLFQEKPTILCSIVEKLSPIDIQLRFPKILSIKPSRSRAKIASLNPMQKPVIDEALDGITLKWSQRVYDLDPEKLSTKCDQIATLSSSEYILQTMGVSWRELVQAVVSGDRDKILDATMNLNDLLADQEHNDGFVDDVTSEGAIVASGIHFCEYMTTLRRASVVQVQVIAEVFNGMLTPGIQLFNLTPSINICLEHRTNPVKCFAEITSLQATKIFYCDVAAYHASWLPVLAMEAAHKAVHNNETFIIRNVEILWEKVESGNIIGSFEIDVRFCKERMIKLRPTEVISSDNVLDESAVRDAHCQDYLCVRYSDVNISMPSTELRHIDSVIDRTQPIIWVAHCTTTNVKLDNKKKKYLIDIRLQQSTFSIPTEILNSISGQHMRSTVEWIAKTLPDR